jgi:hypothetical protein
LHKYLLYRLGVHSEIPLWEEEVEDCPEDVRVVWRSGGIERRDTPGPYKAEIDLDGTVRLSWPGIATASIREGREIYIETIDDDELNNPRHLITGLGMGLILHQRGVFTLHSSAVAIGECAVGVSGAKGSGKSTTAAALSGRGHTLLSDDVLALDMKQDGAPRVLPGPRTLNLWPDTAEAIGHNPSTLPRTSLRSEKRVSRVPVDRDREGFPLKCIFFLEISEDDDGPRIERYSPSDGIGLLIGNSHAMRVVEDRSALPVHLLQCARVMKDVDLFRLKRPAGLEQVQDVARLIEEHVYSLYSLTRTAPRL